MGYAAEKKKVEKKIKRVKRNLLYVFLACILVLIIFMLIIPPNTWAYRIKLPKTGERADGELRIHFVDVGQGDATVIELPDGKIMLIDGGNGSDTANKLLLRYLNALKVERIDYLLATHADKDHCGGLEKVLEHFEVSRVFLPFVNPTANSAFARFYQTVKEKGCAVEYSARNITLSGVEYHLQFLYPYTSELQSSIEKGEYQEDTNESSAVVWLDYQGVNALFTGDAPKIVEEKLVRDDKLGLLDSLGIELTSTEILKVAHHGSDDSTGAEFLEYLGVETAVISCGENNAYNHPSPTVNALLAQKGVDTYRTDKQGSIIATVAKNGSYSLKTLGK
ncbi:MAG: MBL fold metallo-hydrolase [Clostridia bacterium]|nr:MBL fold metallo-hydrolase [Clostridia bacterium]